MQKIDNNDSSCGGTNTSTATTTPSNANNVVGKSTASTTTLSSTTATLLNNLTLIQRTEFITKAMNKDTQSLPIIPPTKTLPGLNSKIQYNIHDNHLFDNVHVKQQLSSLLQDRNGQQRPMHLHDGIIHAHCCEVSDTKVRVWKGNKYQQAKKQKAKQQHGNSSPSECLIEDNPNYQSIATRLHQPSTLSSNQHVFTLYDRLLHQECAPRKVYRKTNHLFRSTIHWGQRKLLLSEIEFLTLYAPSVDHYGPSKQIQVVYAGAAPGIHIALLSDMFPHVKFTLIDPNPFDERLYDKKYQDRIECRQVYFTDELCNSFKSCNNQDKVMLFLSDVRSADPNTQQHEEHEEWVKKDMDNQMNWIATMKPRFSMIKFRLPYCKGHTLYLDGLIFLPVWGRQATTETRLVIDGENMRLKWYDNVQYEEQMFYFNRVTRPSFFPHTIRVKGIDYCHDCRCELYILEKYIEIAPPSFPYRTVHGLSDRITRDSESGRNLFQVIRSNSFNFSKVKHLEHKQQSDRAKQEERFREIEKEGKKKRKYMEPSSSSSHVPLLKRNCR